MILVKYDAAIKALAEATTIDEVKGLADKAAAMGEYARQANNKELEGRAAEIRIRAERRLGQMLIEQKETEGLNPGQLARGSQSEPRGKQLTLKEMGIDKKLSVRAQKFATLPEAKFEQLLVELNEEIHTAVSRVSTNILKKGEVEKQNEELKEKSINTQPPDGLYSTIVIDPPWPIEKIKRDVRPNQVPGLDYPTMTLDEIRDFPVQKVCADNTMIFLWTTVKFLPDSFRILAHWGFDYIFPMIWHKSGGFQPFNLPQYNAEFVLFGRRGKLPFLDTTKFSICFHGLRREHSRKPQEFYELLARVTPAPRIDIFSREARDGFTNWGNETERFTDALPPR